MRNSDSLMNLLDSVKGHTSFCRFLVLFALLYVCPPSAACVLMPFTTSSQYVHFPNHFSFAKVFWLLHSWL